MSACPVVDLESKKKKPTTKQTCLLHNSRAFTDNRFPTAEAESAIQPDSPAQRRAERQNALALDLQRNALNMIFQGMIYNSMSAGTTV